MARIPTKKRKSKDSDADAIKVGDEDLAIRVGSSSNVFADLGLPNPEERLAKARLAGEINAIIERNGWDQATAAARLGIHQPTVSNLKRGRLKSITYDRLMDWLLTLGMSVTISVAKKQNPHIAVAIAR